jgi:DHA2 family methylenomycin A resistance protein-like MFS transporter
LVALTIGADGAAILIFGTCEAMPILAGSLPIDIGGATPPEIVSATLETVQAGRTGVGSAVLNIARQAGGAFGIAILGALIGASYIPAALFVIATSFLLGAAVLWGSRR